jgi:hypothetical protein
VALEQATPYRKFPLPVLFGLATIDQLVPFHDSTNVGLPEALEKLPTAVQLVALEQATLWREESIAPAGFGLATIDQLVPSHDSTRVASPEALVE